MFIHAGRFLDQGQQRVKSHTAREASLYHSHPPPDIGRKTLRADVPQVSAGVKY